MKKIASIIAGLLFTASPLFAQMKVVAHRGYWNCPGAAQNSIAALRNAHEVGVWASEFDVHITIDGVIVVNHDDDLHGTIIEEATYADIKDMTLANGETIPTLRQYLEAGKPLGDLRLVLEVKAHKTAEREDRCVAACLKEVTEMGLQDRVDYISFSLHACEQLIKLDPKVRVYYLNGELSPTEVKAKGFAGIDYAGDVLMQHPEWIAQAHDLGMKVNVWTIDEVHNIERCRQGGVDYITTNKPAEALHIANAH